MADTSGIKKNVFVKQHVNVYLVNNPNSFFTVMIDQHYFPTDITNYNSV